MIQFAKEFYAAWRKRSAAYNKTINNHFDEALAKAIKTNRPQSFDWEHMTCTVGPAAKWEVFHQCFDIICFAGVAREVDYPSFDFALKYKVKSQRQSLWPLPLRAAA